ncbi:hypothetical protein EMIT048CA2_340004 [Pseudomonas chlororaphis]
MKYGKKTQAERFPYAMPALLGQPWPPATESILLDGVNMPLFACRHAQKRHGVWPVVHQGDRTRARPGSG